MSFGTAGNDSLTGGSGNDLLSGLAGNDTLRGADGDDSLFGDEGDDQLDGGAGNDLGIDLAGRNTLAGGDGDDTLSSAAFSLLDGGAGQDFIASAGYATILGGGGDDTINAGAGDLITTGSGADTIVLPASFVRTDPNTSILITLTDFTAGDAGDRLNFGGLLSGPSTTGYQGGNPFGTVGYLHLRQDGADTVVEWDANGGGNEFAAVVRLQGVGAGALTAINLGLTVNGGTDQGQTIFAATVGATLTGGVANDTLVGSAGDDWLNGGLGADKMFGGTDNDTYIVNDPLDVVYETAGNGTDTIITSVSLTLGAHIENLTLAAGSGALAATGNALSNVIIGNNAMNTLIGGDSTDFLFGEGGNDLLFGDAENDMLAGGIGDDTLDGGANPAGFGDILLGGPGNDVYLVDSALDFIDEGNISVYASYGFGGFDTIRSTANFFWDVFSIGERLIIEEGADDPLASGTTAVGSVFGNEMIGNSGTNILFGRGGADTYRAGDGIDYISLSTLGVTDAQGYIANGANTVIVDPRTTGTVSYDIVFEFEPGWDRLDLSRYHYASAAAVLATGVDDQMGNCYFALGDGLDYLYLIGIVKADISAGDFIL